MTADPGIDVLPLVRTRLLAAAPEFKSVELADDFAELLRTGKMPARSPAGFVTYEKETAKPNKLGTGAHRQAITVYFSVITVTYRKGGRSAGKALTDLFEIRPKELDAIAGWQPSPAYEPCELIMRELLSAPGVSAVFHETKYSTSWQLRSV